LLGLVLFLLAFLTYLAHDSLNGTIAGLALSMVRHTAMSAGLWLLFNPRPWADPIDRDLIEDPNDRSTFLVEMILEQNERKTPADRGVVWFADDALCYSGHATSFRVGRQDVLRMIDAANWNSINKEGKTLRYALQLRPQRENLWVVLVPIERKEWSDQGKALAEALIAFDVRNTRSNVERQYPPFSTPPPING
jgi:hypothetical protein